MLQEHRSKLAERRAMMSTAMPTASPAAVRAGADLRAARERLGWALQDVSTGLRIRLCHLQALEEGDIAVLPGSAYAVGYLRAYARALGLDAEEMVRRVKAETAEVGQRTELAFPVPMPDRGLPVGAVILLGLVLSIGAYVGWYRLSGDGHLPAEAVTAIPERLAPLAEQALPPATAPVPAAVTPSVLDVPAKTTTAVAAANPPATEPTQMVPPISPSSAAAAPVRDAAGDHPTTPAASPATVAAANPGAPASALMNPGTDAQLMLRANSIAWMQVKDRSGTVLLNRTMKPGESWPVPRQDNLLLTTGNAGGTEILLDGATTPSLGASGAVRRDLPLDLDLIRDGKLSAAAAPQLMAAKPRQ